MDGSDGPALIEIRVVGADDPVARPFQGLHHDDVHRHYDGLEMPPLDPGELRGTR